MAAKPRKSAKSAETPEMTLEDRIARLEAWANASGASLTDGPAEEPEATEETE